MDITIINNPRIYFTPSERLLDLLLKCSEAHYDSACKSAGRSDGFLARWKLSVHSGVLLNEPAPREVEASPRDLDLTMKICEVQRYVLGKRDEEDLKLLNDFRKEVGQAMVQANVWESAPLVGMTDL